MSKAPSIPLFVDAYMADTMHLSEAEDGVYMRLLMCMWRMGGQLPDDDAKLARFARVSKSQWIKKYRPELEIFFDIKDGLFSQKRLKKEWDYVSQKVERNRTNGGKGGRPKSLENNNTDKPNGYSKQNPPDNPNLTQTESTQPQPHSNSKLLPPQPPRGDDDCLISKWLWENGVGYLRSHGETDAGARVLITAWLLEHDTADVKNAILTAQVSARGKPQAYIIKILQNRKAEKLAGVIPFDRQKSPEQIKADEKAEIDAAFEKIQAKAREQAERNKTNGTV